MKEQRKLIRWIKAHKKELIIAGLSIGTLIAVVLGIKNRETITEVWVSLRRALEKPAQKTIKVLHETKTTEAVMVSPTVPITEKATTMSTSLLGNAVEKIERRGNTIPYRVSRHIRTLSQGRHPSPEKVEAALKMNIVLQDGQTWVEAYMKGMAAA